MADLPEFAAWMNPLLRALRELGGSARPREVCDKIARDHRVSDAVLEQALANGVSRYENQVHWTRYYLAETGYIDRSRRGVWRLTEQGVHSTAFSESEIRAIIEEVQANSGRQQMVPINRRAPVSKSGNQELSQANPETPAPDETREDYQTELLTMLRSISPASFERLCQRLLREAGFEQVVVTGRSGDGGIDGHGVLAVNAFVSFRVLFQCKRYEGAVGPGQVRDFRGAMQGRADKGIVLTTGSFSADAKREAIRDGVPPIELVDGERLVSLFEQLELGLIPRRTFEVDRDFFREYLG